MVNGVHVGTSTSKNYASDDEIRKLISQNTYATQDSNGNGQIFSSRDAVGNYIKYDQDQIKLIEQKTVLLSKEYQLQQKINGMEEDSKAKQEAQVALQETENELIKKQREIEERETAKGLTGVETASQNGSLDFIAQGKLDEWKKMRTSIQAEAINRGIDKGFETKTVTNDSAIKSYLKNYKEILSVQGQIQVSQNKASTLSGQQKVNQESYIRSLEKQLGVLQSHSAKYSETGGVYGQGTLDGADLTKEGSQKIIQGMSEAQVEVEQKTSLANAQLKKQKGLLTQIGEGFKASFRNLVDYSLAYRLIGMIQQGFQSLITTTKQLNSNMLNLRIVTGDSLSETQDLMKGYNNIAKEMGRTTQSVADASNDWLRAGYQGKEAIDLTRASLQLSTLGMIDSATATTDLISALKGWKLEAKDVSGVVDKLTAVDI